MALLLPCPLVADDQATIGAAAPSFALRRIQPAGQPEIRLSDYRGRVVLLEFWATWCGPCVKAHDHLSSLFSDADAREFSILSVTDEPQARVRKYLRKHALKYDIATDEDGKIQREYQLSGLPHAVLIDRAGVIRWLGDPRDLTTEDIQQFVRKGTAPQVRTELPDDSGPKKDSRPELILTITRRPDKEPGPTVTTRSKSKDTIEFHCQDTSLRNILAIVLNSGGPRFSIESDLVKQSYDIDFFSRSNKPGKSPDYTILREAIVEMLHLEITTLLEEREVWIVKSNGLRLPRGKGPPEAHIDKQGMYHMRSTPISEFLQIVEGKFKVFVEDETGLKDYYNLSYPNKSDFSSFRDYVAREYGLLLSQERRSISVVSVRRRTP